MNSYHRPATAAPVIHDADGQIIDYGRRWHGSPPEETYSVDTHPERFAPLHTIADALISFLRHTYDVEITEGKQTRGDLLFPSPEVERGVRIRPNNSVCAALTFVFTAHPGILLHAGLLHDFRHPVCGCDACDSNWDVEADQLEREVLAVVNGNYFERIENGFHPRIEFALSYPDGGISGRSRAAGLPADRVAAAKPVLRHPGRQWAPWPLRA